MRANRTSSHGAPGVVLRGGSRGNISAVPHGPANRSDRRSCERANSKDGNGKEKPTEHVAEAPFTISDQFRQAQTVARQLTGTAKLAGIDSLNRLQGDTLCETFGLTGARAHYDAAGAVADGATRAAARMLAELIHKDANKNIPPPAMAVLMRAVSMPPADPITLVDQILQSCESMRLDVAAVEGTVATLTKSAESLLVTWDPSSPNQKIYATRAAIDALIDAEVTRMRSTYRQYEAQWAHSLEKVSKTRDEFQREGFLEKAACCGELFRQMTDGLRGLKVRRVLKSAATGIDQLSNLTSSNLSIDFEKDPLWALPLVAKMRSDAERRMCGLEDVVERETKDADYWATRGRLPDGEQAPKHEEVDVVDIWEDITSEEVYQDLEEIMGGPLSDKPTLVLEDAVVAAMQRLSALNLHVGHTTEALSKYEASLHQKTNRIDEEAIDACRRATAALQSLVKEFNEFHEGLLEVLDVDADGMGEAALAWNALWLADNSALTEAADNMLEAGPAMGATSKQRGLLRAVRGLATLAADKQLRKDLVVVRGVEACLDSEKTMTT